MIETYIRFEDSLRRQTLQGAGRALLLFQLIAAGVLLAGTARGESWGIAICMLMGAAVVAAGLLLHRRSDLWGKVFVNLGAWPAIFFLCWLFLPLGLLAITVYGIVMLVGLVSG